jgi:hypothetical protein
MTEQESMELALLLSNHLRQLTVSSLATYLRTFYRLNGMRGLSVDLIYAIEVASGNFGTGGISSVPIRTWEIGKESCRLIPFVNMAPFNAASDLGTLWPHPIISYYAEFPNILSTEGIGQTVLKNGVEQTMKYYRVLTVDRINGVLSIVAENKGWLFRG